MKRKLLVLALAITLTPLASAYDSTTCRKNVWGDLTCSGTNGYTQTWRKNVWGDWQGRDNRGGTTTCRKNVWGDMTCTRR